MPHCSTRGFRHAWRVCMWQRLSAPARKRGVIEGCIRKRCVQRIVRTHANQSTIPAAHNYSLRVRAGHAKPPCFECMNAHGDIELIWLPPAWPGPLIKPSRYKQPYVIPSHFSLNVHPLKRLSRLSKEMKIKREDDSWRWEMRNQQRRWLERLRHPKWSENTATNSSCVPIAAKTLLVRWTSKWMVCGAPFFVEDGSGWQVQNNCGSIRGRAHADPDMIYNSRYGSTAPVSSSRTKITAKIIAQQFPSSFPPPAAEGGLFVFHTKLDIEIVGGGGGVL